MKRPEDFQGIFIHREKVDMRKGINGLTEVVQDAGMGKITGPNLFVFAGKRKDAIKILYWDKSGFALWQKRLEQARFPWPKKFAQEVVQVTPQELQWLLDGFDVWKMKPFEKVEFEYLS